MTMKTICNDLDLLNNELFVLGGTFYDVGMLLQTLKLNGNASLITYSGEFREQKSDDDIINEYITSQTMLYNRNKINNIYPDYSTFSREAQVKIRQDILKKYGKKFRRQKYIEICKDYKGDNLDIDELYKKNIVLEYLELYQRDKYLQQMFSMTPINHTEESNLNMEEKNEIVEKISVYMSFSDYSRKVLLKK